LNVGREDGAIVFAELVSDAVTIALDLGRRGANRAIETVKLIFDRVTRQKATRDAKSLGVHDDYFADRYTGRNGDALKTFHAALAVHPAHDALARAGEGMVNATKPSSQMPIGRPTGRTTHVAGASRPSAIVGRPELPNSAGENCDVALSMTECTKLNCEMFPKRVAAKTCRPQCQESVARADGAHAAAIINRRAGLTASRSVRFMAATFQRLHTT
jgi:hypothetical protein